MDLIYFVLALLTAWPFLVHGQAAASIANTPKVGPCPPGFSLVRHAGPSHQQSLSKSELAYIRSRKSKVLPGAWKSYLANVQQTKVPLPNYVSRILSGKGRAIPNLGIAASGGGYRAAIFDAGVLNALDGRNSSSISAGLGGLLQSATYLSGLSGGSWLLTSLVQANFPTFEELIFGSNSSNEYAGWLTQFGIVTPTNDSAQNQAYIAELIAEVKGKHDAGFPVTIGDLWARALARHFVNGTTAANFFDNAAAHGSGIIFSGLANL
jgi:lysophospholipase